ncbi:MAG: aminoglycoside phosphotransferase family protein [Nanoarchaeota archaeon]|nr:aminoglycoside phosphotransferase family protein [Nanoarchaeota archaeon]
MVLTVRQVPSYLIRKGVFGKDDAIEVTPLGGGLLNHLFLARSGSKRVALKQAEGVMKFNRSIRFPKERVVTEYHALKAWRELGLKEAPEPLFLDRAEGVVCMAAVPQGYEPLIYDLLAAKVNLRVVRELGGIYGRLHSKSYQSQRLKLQFPISEAFRILKLDLYTHEYRDATPHRSIKKAMERNAKKLVRNRVCLIHGDALPKNVLVRGNRCFILDHEVSVFGDPAHDLALLLGSYYMAAMVNWPVRRRYYAAMRALLRAYQRNIRFKKLFPTILRNSLGYMPSLLFGRSRGKASAEFLDTKTREVMAMLADRIALGNYKIPQLLFRMLDKQTLLASNRPWKKEQLKGRLL